MSRRSVAAIASASVALLLCLRALSELSMMWQHCSDPQMPIWGIIFLIKLALWFLAGSLIAGLLVMIWPMRWGLFLGMPLVLGWTISISVASWNYYLAGRALADASDSSTSARRLSELVHFDGIQAGYELDNRLASNPKTPPEALRELSTRDQAGTDMCLARNPKTPKDVLETLAHHEDTDVIRLLSQNPSLPDSIGTRLKDHPVDPDRPSMP